MASFLITYKPKTENPDRGWPIEDLRRLVHRLNSGDMVVENWRFSNRKGASVGDRTFLLVQGTSGPAVIGYGRIAGEQEKEPGQRATPIKFERLVDPSKEVLASRDELQAIDAGRKFWRTQSSGVRLPDDVAKALDALVVGRAALPSAGKQIGNPDWTRDELILALTVYLSHRPHLPGSDSQAIVDLSRNLNRLGGKLFPGQHRAATFRNENGAAMKLSNFSRLDPVDLSPENSSSFG